MSVVMQSLIASGGGFFLIFLLQYDIIYKLFSNIILSCITLWPPDAC